MKTPRQEGEVGLQRRKCASASLEFVSHRLEPSTWCPSPAGVWRGRQCDTL